MMSLFSDCGFLPFPIYGTVFAPTTTYGSTANYSCNTGYNINGDVSRTCGVDGSGAGVWSGSEPTCDPVGK